MTNEAIIASAARLGIKPTRAPVGSQVWDCWADRVREVQIYDTRYRCHLGAGSHIDADIQRLVAAVSEANRYAV